jgi:hypothetical protein
VDGLKAKHLDIMLVLKIRKTLVGSEVGIDVGVEYGIPVG